METIQESFRQMKPVFDEKIIWYAYYQNEPIAFLVCMPDVNQILKKLGNGKLTPLNILKFLWYKNTGTINRARQLLTAVTPEYQRSGVTGALVVTMMEACIKNGIKTLDMSWVGDYNTTVNKIYRLLGLPVARKHLTMRYMFDPDKEVVRFTNTKTEKSKRLAGD